MKILKQVIVLGIVLVSFQCANTSYYQTWGTHKVRLNGYSANEGYAIIDSFEITFTRVYMFWGLSNIRDKSLDELLAEIYLKHPNTSIGDLKISEEYEFSDSIYDLVTFGILRPYTLHLKGNIYSKNTGSGSK
ncbi:hypothetical protein ND861_09045 [Leptospira sp. 2 VSF19]|uniref:Lipoprotein n=1 Tax=Leptospira soteropolitanensis TaxID=2950025 RepID=A0AAW5VBM9_9LEPT|nr:hypothetical protein [Leptospira soteropolitanensis]MCW7492651.1 hypothetical protein [Leptospira soteropolitanensis]MCW7500334.1 hypothetical protein [Leptospira soteropolitanensis]MCW7522631.1 hypothetical protein [Leptospira soteropolitanensis]MCW7526487.1 hypothetical protein [Leptospira soteropolitanensis]MCW7530304.1 hypothetical protein [Leptospira soteropolitanensis]